jgi:hypothetical protein
VADAHGSIRVKSDATPCVQQFDVKTVHFGETEGTIARRIHLNADASRYTAYTRSITNGLVSVERVKQMSCSNSDEYKHTLTGTCVASRAFLDRQHERVCVTHITGGASKWLHHSFQGTKCATRTNGTVCREICVYNIKHIVR